MPDKTKKGPAVVLKEYFGYRPGGNMQDFAAELRALDPKDKLELARLAAVELGYKQADVAFTLTD